MEYHEPISYKGICRVCSVDCVSVSTNCCVFLGYREHLQPESKTLKALSTLSHSLIYQDTIEGLVLSDA